MKKEFWLATLLHFFVDFFSVYALLSFHLSAEWAFALTLAYDALAFLPQPLFGAIIEKSHFLAYLGSLGCLLVVIGALVPEAITAVIFVGLGNALFHVSEGKLVLEKSERSAPLGVFISGGSLGLGLALSFENLYLFIGLLLLFLIAAIVNCFLDYSKRIPFVYAPEAGKEKTLKGCLVLIVLGVFLRGFFGQYTAYAWPTNGLSSYNVLWVAIAVFLGKAIGGFILDFSGSVPLIIFSSLLSFVCAFFPTSFWASMVGVVGVNLLMALTMEFMRRATPKNLGFGFGLLAAFLLLGYCSGVFLKGLGNFQTWLTPLLMLLNGLSLIFAFILLKRSGRKETSVWAKKKEGGVKDASTKNR
jgi:hypothetical protein